MTTDRDRLVRLAVGHGVLTSYADIWGQRHEASNETLAALLAELDVDPNSVEVAGTNAAHDSGHERAPEGDACFQPDALAAGGRVWGPAVQLYSLRSHTNWGIGDFGDLLTVIDQWAARGASLVGLNPLHALFAHNPSHISPYSPSSRLRLNTLYVAVDSVVDLVECEEARTLIASPDFQARLAVLRASDTVRYPEVAALKTQVLRLLHAQFAGRHRDAGPDPRRDDYRRFLAEGGPSLLRHALFEALQGHFFAADSEVWGWPVWPEAYRSPDAPAVAAFLDAQRTAVDFHLYLQWLADRQLAAARQRCVDRGMAIGLYLDLAVSVDRAGSDAWSHAAQFAPGATIGAPPDEVNPNGQGWGLPPLRPDRLRETGYALFSDTVRAAMRHAGALRFDHVMGLMRLYWIPPGQSPAAGAYVLYPLDELISIVVRESQANRCLVIGEDLGTVADEIRTAMRRFGMLSYRLLYFERTADGAFTPPEAYPRRALVAVSTHDLPTLAGWWTGHDLVVRQRLGLFPAGTVYEQQLAGRAQDRMRLLLALERAGLLPVGVETRLDSVPQLTQALAEAVHAFAASSEAEVMLVQLEDVLGVEDQANLPGTVDQHPNWRQRLPLSLEALATDPRFASLASRIAVVRPRPETQCEAGASHEAIVPRATYRLQFHKGFGFDDAIRVLPYLERLGISHVYCSPILRARAGSTHGYDVVAHDQINPELGGEAGFERFTAALRVHGMGQLLDMVPNHMGVLGSDNAWWNDVVENGISSPYADYFDIDWHPVNTELDGKVLLPVLGRQYGEALDAGELALEFDRSTGSFGLTYFEHRFPLDPRSYAEVLDRAAAGLADDAAADGLRSLATAFSHLPRHDVAAASAPALERRRDQQLLKQRLAALLDGATDVAAPLAGAIAGAVAVINAEPARDALHGLHESQAYRLAYWRVAADEINYRRFFDINELAGLRMEDPRVFEATQGFSLDLAAAGKVDGLRIDHPDGLQDPAQYFARLQDGFARRAGLVAADGSTPLRPLYLVAEKIAASHEDVPADWRIHGTTGYRFAMVVNGVLVDADSASAFDAIWARFAGHDTNFAELAYAGKRGVAGGALASELTVLATTLLRIAKGSRQTRDYTFNSLRSTLAEIAACLPVYRTYVVDAPSEQDDRYIDWAVVHARRRSNLADLSIFDFAKRCMRSVPAAGATVEQVDAVRRFAQRFQQFSSPVAAKGVEDTAFYQYHRLVSLNEVGGDPATFGMSTRAFHGANSDRQAHWPDTIIATSTHDNKRSEDVRCRLDVLSEMPEAWAAALDRWQKLAVSARGDGTASPAPAPAPADEYLLYQVLLGTLPADGLDEAALPGYRERVCAYLRKAVREGKERSSWTQPDEAYEAGLDRFVEGALARVHPNPLLTDVQVMASELAWFGAMNSVTMAVLKYTVPGVPDLYQGNELLDLSLVDPDNRRPVDYDLRAGILRDIEDWGESEQADRCAGLARSLTDGRLKLLVIHRLLRLRAQIPDLFRRGDYQPLTVAGDRCEHVIAFARSAGAETVAVVAGRLFARLNARQVGLPTPGSWSNASVELPSHAGRWQDVFTGKALNLFGHPAAVAELLSILPVAVLRLRSES